MPLRSHYRLTADRLGCLPICLKRKKSNQDDIAMFIANFAQQQIKGKAKIFTNYLRQLFLSAKR